MEHLHRVVGLGNPGEEYVRTRHNAGFQVVEELARRWEASWDAGKAFRARLARASRGSRRVLLCEPLSFMNASGEVVRAVADYFAAAPGQVLVVLDDADLPLGEIRLRGQGGSGGHHGLESVLQHLGSQRVARLRLGIGRRDDAGRELTGHVLGQFSRDEARLFGQVLARVADQAECWLEHGLQKAMNEFNGVVDPEEAK